MCCRFFPKAGSILDGAPARAQKNSIEKSTKKLQTIAEQCWFLETAQLPRSCVYRFSLRVCVIESYCLYAIQQNATEFAPIQAKVLLSEPRLLKLMCMRVAVWQALRHFFWDLGGGGVRHWMGPTAMRDTSGALLADLALDEGEESEAGKDAARAACGLNLSQHGLLGWF